MLNECNSNQYTHNYQVFFIQFMRTHLPNEWQIVTADFFSGRGSTCNSSNFLFIYLFFLIGLKVFFPNRGCCPYMACLPLNKVRKETAYLITCWLLVLKQWWWRNRFSHDRHTQLRFPTIFKKLNWTLS